jgi:hypothetical protein
MKMGYVCLGFQPMCVKMNDSNQLNKFLMSLFKYKPKRNVGLHDISKLTYSHLEC